MNNPQFGPRHKKTYAIQDPVSGVNLARSLFAEGRTNEAFDAYEQTASEFPNHGVPVLADAYDTYQKLPNKVRYHLYQSRHFDFCIKPGEKVLDIGSGHMPFPLATHLADLAVTDHHVGRAGAPFKYVEGKPVFECDLEDMPFGDKEFDFVYCSHVLEHAKDPARACRELMRVGRRGFFETPTPGKDLFLNSAKISNHAWAVELIHDVIVFTEYTPAQIEGFACNVLMDMHCAPASPREKAFAALIWLKATLVNTMAVWEGDFKFEVRKSPAKVAVSRPLGAAQHDGASEEENQEKTNPRRILLQSPVEPRSKSEASPPRETLRFLQVHTFYDWYLAQFYERNPFLAKAPFGVQMAALVNDGFSGVHIFAPYMQSLGYEQDFVIANCPQAQLRWAEEKGMQFESPGNVAPAILARQIEEFSPDVLYLTDPIALDSRFIRTLKKRPRLVVGWRAANIPAGTDWSEFDLMLSGLSSLREAALQLGAKRARPFFPGFPVWSFEHVRGVTAEHDVVFSGQCSASSTPSGTGCFLMSPGPRAKAVAHFLADGT